MENEVVDPGLVEIIFTAMNSGDLFLLEEHLADHVSMHFPGPGLMEGKKRVLLFLKVLRRKYPVLEFSVNDIVLDKGRACAVWTNRGENTGGEAYANSGVTLVKVSNGKIEFISDYFKDTSFVEP